MGTHDGHRERLKHQFMEHGLDVMSDHTVLELLLFYAVPRRDTNALAHALIDRFGSLAAVFRADPAQLQSVPGLGAHAATLLHLIPQVNRRFLLSVQDAKNAPLLDTAEKAGKFMFSQLLYENAEVHLAACLDAKSRLTHCTAISRGTVNAVEVSARRLMEYALNHNAHAVILAHNHPGGYAIPSWEDLEATRAVKAMLDSVGIGLLDHIIVADGDYVSLASSGLL